MLLGDKALCVQIELAYGYSIQGESEEAMRLPC